MAKITTSLTECTNKYIPTKYHPKVNYESFHRINDMLSIPRILTEFPLNFQNKTHFITTSKWKSIYKPVLETNAET